MSALAGRRARTCITPGCALTMPPGKPRDSLLPGTVVPGGIINQPMKAYVYVSLKKSVLDPQGKTIQAALRKMGHAAIADVRQGKYFEITLDGGLDEA